MPIPAIQIIDCHEIPLLKNLSKVVQALERDIPLLQAVIEALASIHHEPHFPGVDC